jgi:hypothetical protein
MRIKASERYSRVIVNKGAAFVAGLLLYCLSAPYFCWSIIGNPYGNFLLGTILAFLFFINKVSFSLRERWLFIAFIAILILYWQTSGYNIFFFLLFTPVLMMPFCRDSFANKAYQYFFTIYSVVMAISIIEYVLAVPGIISPLFTIPPLNEIKGDVYKVYFTMVTMEERPVRFCGAYDEPGVVGTMSALLLAKESFNFKDKRVIVAFLAGLISFSLFFYVAVFICWLINILRKKKPLVAILWLSVIISLSVIIVVNVPVLNEKIAERLTIDESTGKLAGDDRVDMFIVADYLDQMEGRAFWFGIDDKAYYLEIVKGSSSIFNTIIVHGWLFFICYSLFFIVYFLAHKNRKIPFVIFFFLYFATIYQRPDMFAYFYVFLFTMMARSSSVGKNEFPIINRDNVIIR